MTSEDAPAGGAEAHGDPNDHTGEGGLLTAMAEQMQVAAGVLVKVLIEHAEEISTGLQRGVSADYVPEVGAVVKDTTRDLVGVVVEVDGSLVRLRPAGAGGWRWRALVADVEPAGPTCEMGARAADISARYDLRRLR
ncbi:hypothetical protein [Streptantibioticus ferralitis]|uniref:Uncharacterized protein n=1 Tax=Streptantibioticus ferralitis TaxID=236510 RepID=A0ABT5YUS4_9ACTN|nr:hypothetical protein [Streptantibioticus ferralitis]MDF2255351.1 hypothetical protein [Streptantibioticus ferralitis]